MRARHAVSVRTLNRWQTLWLLCRICCADVALALVIEVAKEKLTFLRRLLDGEDLV